MLKMLVLKEHKEYSIHLHCIGMVAEISVRVHILRIWVNWPLKCRVHIIQYDII